jgi:cell wall assembly regulator SMI1
MEILESGDALTPTDIETFEATIGKPLPPAYRNFLLTHNGGHPVPPVIDIDDCPNGATVVQVFLSLTGPVESETLGWSWQAFQGRIPERLLPIADDPFGNIFCLSLDGADAGQMVFLDRYVESEARPYFVAQDFTTFLAKLRVMNTQERALASASASVRVTSMV